MASRKSRGVHAGLTQPPSMLLARAELGAQGSRGSGAWQTRRTHGAALRSPSAACCRAGQRTLHARRRRAGRRHAGSRLLSFSPSFTCCLILSAALENFARFGVSTRVMHISASGERGAGQAARVLSGGLLLIRQARWEATAAERPASSAAWCASTIGSRHAMRPGDSRTTS